jgi:hypothetical protein
MERRDLLKTLGAAGALALLPHEAMAAWTRVATGFRPVGGLTEAQIALINAIADTLIPRTDTPGAVDMNVSAFIDVIVHEQYTDTLKAEFLAGLDAIESDAKANGGSAFADLAPTARGAAIERIESPRDRRVEPQRTYWRLKGLIVHGYFTSERIQKEVLKVQVMPGAYRGDAPHVLRPTESPRSGAENQSARSAAEHHHE